MIIPRYHIGPSRIACAGKGLFLDEPLARGRVIVAPDAIPGVHTLEEIARMPHAQDLLPATVRWFEEAYTVTPEWPDECYVNHAFAPTGLWHLGFIFAASALDAGTEITVDYRHLLAPGQQEEFLDAQSGERIVGYSWEESLRASTRALAEIIA